MAAVPTDATHREIFLRELHATFGTEAHSDAMMRGIYATDASIYMQRPLAVVTPRSADEAVAAVAMALRHGVPVLPRAGGTSLAGQTTAEMALVVDISKHLQRLLEVNEAERWAMVEPGLIRDVLNARIAGTGLMFAPETSTSNRANIAGMLGNNSSGMMSCRYGKTIDHILGCETLLADGTRTWFGRRSEMDAAGVALLDRLMDLVNRHRALIESRFPKVLRRVGGYSLDEFLGDDPNLARIMVGAEGTLGLVTRIKVNLVPKPRVVLAIACHFADMGESLRAVPLMMRHDPLSAEFMDGALLRMCRENPSTAPMMGWLVGDPAAVIPIEMDGESTSACIDRLEAIKADLRAAGVGYHISDLYTPAARLDIVEVRKAGLGVMLREVGDHKAISFIEDACVPIDVLDQYAQGIIDICAAEGLDLMTYGHASVGVLHLKPIVNLKTQEDRDKCARVSRRAMELCRSFGGSWSGEHGDGIARGAENESFWGAEMIEVFREVKRLFDPTGLMNPGKIFDTPPVMGPLRFADGYQQSTHQAMFHFRGEGGFQGAVEMCNGVGACRKIGTGTMCPSYMATRNEQDSTRGRANALRLALAGQLGTDAFTSQELHDVLDLCLECKACSTECPSNIDMARMKSEFLHAWHGAHGTPLRDRVFGHSPAAARLNAGWPAPIVNAILGARPVRRAIGALLGLAPQRPLPRYARETVPAWFRRFRSQLPADAPAVVIFNDTYANYHEPEIGRAAVLVLEALGVRAEIANAGCCCRPMISKGLLDEAKSEGTRTMANLDRLVAAGRTILTLEPSCTSALQHDLPDLMDDAAMGRRVAAAVMPIEDYLDRESIMGRVRIDLPHAAPKYLLHGHCHQKALNGTGPVKRLLGAADGRPRVDEVDSGCCGMAGSFGYEREHYSISQQIGESRLFPAVRDLPPGQPVIACGFSCRHQIAEATGHSAQHTIIALARAMGLPEE